MLRQTAVVVLIRLATENDIALFALIDASTEQQFVDAGHPEFRDGGTIPDDTARRAITAGSILVAEVDGVVAGWAFVTRSGSELCVGQISVHAEQQGHGIGTGLMQRIIADAVAAGEASIVLNTQDDVAWNRPWYESLGFRVVAPVAWTDDMHTVVREQTAEGLDWSTRVHMRLVLDG